MFYTVCDSDWSGGRRGGLKWPQLDSFCFLCDSLDKVLLNFPQNWWTWLLPADWLKTLDRRFICDEVKIIDPRYL